MPFSEEEAIKTSNLLISFLNTTTLIEKLNIEEINYRLGHDDDRQKSNYMMKNENGHVNNKKCKINLKTLDEKNEADYNNSVFRSSDGE